MSDKLYQETVAEVGTVIDDRWLEVHVKKLEALPVFASFSWGWSALMATDPEFRREISIRSLVACGDKPFGCALCEEKEATMYHPYAGRVYPACHATLPKE